MDNNFDNEYEKLKKEQEAALEKRAMFGAIAPSLDSFANTQSAADILLKRKPERLDVAASFKAASDSVVDPMEQQKKRYDLLNNYRQAKLASKTDAESAALDDANSPESLQEYESLTAAGLKVKPGMSAKIYRDTYGKASEFAKTKWEKDMAHSQAIELERLKNRGEIDKARVSSMGLIPTLAKKNLSKTMNSTRVSQSN